MHDQTPLDNPTALLERATPTEVPELDYHRLAHRGTSRRRARRTLAAATAVAATAGVVTFAAGELRQPTQVAISQPSTPTPWTTVADLPGPRLDAYTAMTSSGDILVYGGTDKAEEAQPLRDGLVIDPATGGHVKIPPPPIDARPFPARSLAGQRLLVFGGNDDSRDGAVYDLTTATWTPIPEVTTSGQPGATSVHHWDGSTLIVGGPQHDGDDTDDSPGDVSFWAYDTTSTSDEWAPLPQLPIVGDTITTTGRDGRLAVATYDRDAPSVPRLAIFDVDAQTWDTIEADLPTVAWAELVWTDDRLVLVPVPADPDGARDGIDDRGERATLPAPIGISTDGTATTLDPLPDLIQRTTLDIGDDIAIDPDPTLIAKVGTSATILLADGTWTPPTQATHAMTIQGILVAIDSPWQADEAAISTTIWTGTGWTATSTSTQPARGLTDPVANDRGIYFVSGATPGSTLGFRTLSGHEDVIRFTPAD